MSDLKIPGTAWIALITALSAWVQETWHEPWVTGVVIGLGAAVKLIEVYWPESTQESTRFLLRSRSKWRRWWMG